MRATQLVVAAVGAVIGAWGAWLLAATGWSNIVAAVTWLVGGVVVHDAILAPLTIVLTFLALRVLPPVTRPAAAAAAVVIGTVTVVAVPVLGRPGAEPDNPSLLPRDYVLGWAVIVVLVLAVAGATALRSARAQRPRETDVGSDGGAH